MKHIKRSFVTPILAKIARKLKVQIHIEPEFGYVGYIVLPDGRKKYFRNTNFDLNPLGASEIAKDKAYASYFIRRLGYPTPKEKVFFTKKWAEVINSRRDSMAAYRYARSIGFPVIVKPNSKSQGLGVCKVFNKKQLLRAVGSFSQNEQVFLVQEVVEGNDYRIVVLDGKVISAYQRFPLEITGDGRSSIEKLLRRKQSQFKRSGRDTRIQINDFRITLRLKRLKMSLLSVLSKGERLKLLANANLSTGGDAVDVTTDIHPQWQKIAINLTKEMNLRYCGVDIIAKSVLAQPPGEFVILEINAAPGLDNYASASSQQRRIVEQIYEKVLRALLK